MTQRYAIIVAGGAGRRLGAEMPKQFIPLGGLPMLAHSLKAFHAFDENIRIILVLPEDRLEEWETLAGVYPLHIPYRVVSGGQERYHSVKNALDSITDTEGLVAIHDAARPFISSALIERTFGTAAGKGSAVPAVPLKESIRQYSEGEWRTADRSRYRIIQTPQAFSLGKLKAAYEQAYQPHFTDDASVYEAVGHKVEITEGEPDNIKITTAGDLEFARYMFEHN